MNIKSIIFSFLKEYGTERGLSLAIGIDHKKLRAVINKEIMPCNRTLLFLALRGINIGLLMQEYKNFQIKYDIKKHYSKWGTYVWKLGNPDSTLGITYDEYLKLNTPKFNLVTRKFEDSEEKIIYSGSARAVARRMRDIKVKTGCEETSMIFSEYAILVDNKQLYYVEEVKIPSINILL